MKNNQQLVYVLEMMECDWDGEKYIKGVFSTSNKAINYVRDNYYLLKGVQDICIRDFSIKGEVFKQYGYDIPPSELFEDEDGLFYLCQYDVDEPIVREYVNTQTVFTIRGIKLDELI